MWSKAKAGLGLPVEIWTDYLTLAREQRMARASEAARTLYRSLEDEEPANVSLSLDCSQALGPEGKVILWVGGVLPGGGEATLSVDGSVVNIKWIPGGGWWEIPISVGRGQHTITVELAGQSTSCQIGQPVTHRKPWGGKWERPDVHGIVHTWRGGPWP